MINNILQKIYDRFFASRSSIKEQVQRLLFITGVVSLATVGSISLAGMFYARYHSLKTGEEMGREVAFTVNDKLRDESEERLKLLADERADQIGLQLLRIEEHTDTIAKRVTDIIEHEENYKWRKVDPPKKENGGVMSVQLEFAPWAEPANLQHEIGITANISDLMLYMANLSGEGSIISVASKNGFSISVDADANHRFKEGSNTPLPFDSTARPWYKTAVLANKTTFTAPYKNTFGGQIRIACVTPYRKNGEFEGVVVLSTALKDVSDMVLSDNETCFVIDQNGQILFSQDATGMLKAMTKLSDSQLNGVNLTEIKRKSPAFINALSGMMAGEKGTQEHTYANKTYYIAYAPITKTGWSFAAVLDASDIRASEEEARQEVLTIAKANTENLEGFIYRLILIMLVSIAVLIYIFRKLGSKVGNRFARPIMELSDDVREIASGNLDKKIDIHTGDEIEHLAICFNIMTEELSDYMKNLTKITAEKERIATELNVATNIQAAMLPNNFPARDEFSIYATMRAAKKVGGDFYDFYMVDEDHLMITIADVSGKGIPAALFMVISKTILKNFALSSVRDEYLPEIVDLANKQLAQNNETMMFVTSFIGVLNIKSGRFVYVNAGHNPPLIYRAAEDKFSYLSVAHNFVLAGMEDARFKSEELTLSPGDEIFLYTDGVTEALNEEKELYGEERLLNCLNNVNAKETPLNEQLAKVRQSLDEHVKTAEQSDDITMMALLFR